MLRLSVNYSVCCVQVDLEKMYMTKPFYGELRRRYSPALWLQVRRSEHLTYCRASVHRLQLDNQLPRAHFPTVLCPAPAAGSAGGNPGSSARAARHAAARRGLLKPCVDLLVLKRARPAFNQDVYKYVKVLVQEFCVNLERDFVDALLALPSRASLGWGRSRAGHANGHANGASYDEHHRLLEGLRQDVALSFLPVQLVGLVS